MTDLRSPLHRKRGYWLAIAAVIALVHVGLFMVAGLGRTPLPPDAPTIIDLTLFRLQPPPPPPPPPPVPSRVAGGGAPAAPSRIHTPPPPKQPTPREVPAPPVQAPEPALVVGASDTTSPLPGPGQGGEGTGTGTGLGDGDGPGSGSGPLILRGASQAEILALVPPEARAARVPGRALVNCEIELDTRLSGCRVVSETPADYRFGEAALRVATTHFRFRPPMTASGRPVSGQRVTVSVEFGRQRR